MKNPQNFTSLLTYYSFFNNILSVELDEINSLTEGHTEKVDEILTAKEKEVLEI